MSTAIFEQRAAQCRDLFGILLGSRVFPFDENVRSQLPRQPGLYLISARDSELGKYLHAGGTPTGKSGLRGRIWEQHFTGGGNRAGSDLVQKVIDRVIDKGKPDFRKEAQAWIRANCLVQWVVVEDQELRCWTEHYMLSVVRPIWGR